MKIWILLLSFMAVSNTCHAVELLVKAKDHWMDDLPRVRYMLWSEERKRNFRARSQIGDIVAIGRDGKQWGREETLPDFIIVKVPEVTYVQAQVYLAKKKMVNDEFRRRNFRIRQNLVINYAKQGISEVTITKAQLLNAIEQKKGDATDFKPVKDDVASNVKWLAKAAFDSLDDMFVPKAHAATRLHMVVAPSGGDYTSLEACMNANEKDLVAADEYFDVEISGSWVSPDATAVTVHNYTTDATRYINIYTDSANAFDGSYDTSKYRIIVSTSGEVVSVNASYTTITGLQIYNSHWATGDPLTPVGIRLNTDFSNILFDKIYAFAPCFAISSYNASGSSGSIFKIRNSVLISDYEDTNRRGAALNVTGGDTAHGVDVHNSILLQVGANGYGIQVDTVPVITIVNSYARAASGVEDYNNVDTLTTSASSDTTGSVGLQNVAYSTSSGAYFTSVTLGSEDFHITNTSSALYDAGTDLSSDFTDDIDGDTRTGTWDIGIDNIPTSGGGGEESDRRFMMFLTKLSGDDNETNNFYNSPLRGVIK